MSYKKDQINHDSYLGKIKYNQSIKIIVIIFYIIERAEFNINLNKSNRGL